MRLVGLSLLVLAGCTREDPKDTDPPVDGASAPEVRFTAPDGVGPYYADHDVRFAGVVSDAEDAPGELTLVWTDAAGAELDIDAAVAEDGTVEAAYTFATGSHDVTLTATDTSARTGSATVSFEVGGPNTPPVCAITAPADGAIVAAGETVSLAGTVTDIDVDEEWLTGEWASDLDGPLASGAADADGNVSFDTAALSLGLHTLTLTGVDEVGGTCAASIVVEVSGPPSVDIDLPLDGDVYNEGDVVSFAATVADDFTPAEALVLTWESDVDGLLDTTPADASGVAGFDAAWLAVGTHTVTLTATDAAGLSTSATATFVVNGLPGAPVVTIDPSDADGEDELVATVTEGSVDPESDDVAYTFTWYVDGAPSGYASDTVPASATTRGEVWEVHVTPNDGYGDGVSGVASVTIGNTPPTLAGVTLTPDPAYEGDTLLCAPGATADGDGDVVDVTYAWTVAGATVDATTATLDDGWWARGDVVVCTVTPTDGITTGASVSSAPVTIGNTPPRLASVAITPAEPGAADTLTCAATGFSDADGDADASVYTWTVDGAPAGTGTTLSSGFVSGSVVACTVTPHDGLDAGAPLSAEVTVGNTPPVLADVTLSPESPAEADVLTCAPGATTDIDATPGFSYTYRWTVDGAAIAATTPTLDGEWFDRGDVVQCAVTPNDGEDDGAEVISNAVTVVDTPPVVTSVTLSPSAPDTDDTLTATVTSTDADGDAVRYAYAWYVNGTRVGVSSASLGGTWFASGDEVYVVVTPEDGELAGAPFTSSTVVIVNSAPVLASVTLTPTTAYEATTLTCTPSATDADGDAVSYAYAWTVNGAAISATSSTLGGTSFDAGDTVACTATPTDGVSVGAARTSNTVTIANTAPVVSAVSLTPTTAYEASTLTCAPSATDADGDTVSYTYAWYVNGAAIAATSSTLTGASFAKGNTVYCRVTPTDGTTAGTAVSSGTVTIANTAPVVSAVTLTPTTAYEASTLTCAPSATDADGDTVSYTYAWLVNGSTIASTSSTLTGASFDRGDTVACRATPSDGTTAGTAASSATVTIGNTAPTAPTLAIDPTAPIAGVDDLLCDIATASTDADGDAVDYDITWTVDGRAYPGTFAGTTGPDTTTWTDDTIPAADTVLGADWTCTVVPFDDAGDGASATASVTVVDTECSGVPVGPVCDGRTISVAYLPGWSATHTGSSSLSFTALETGSLTYGDCTVDFTSVGSGFTLATLSAYDVVFISDPSGGSRLYTAAEQAAIRAYAEGGYGGVVGTFLMDYLTYDNTGLMDLFGIDAAGLNSGSSAVTSGGTVVDASHPVADGLASSFTLLGYAYEQANNGGWTSADLLACASFVIDASGQSSVVANDDYNWRAVYFTGMPEYNSAGTASRQALYNAILWTAGYQ